MEIVINFLQKLIEIEDNPRILRELDEQLARALRKQEDYDANVCLPV